MNVCPTLVSMLTVVDRYAFMAGYYHVPLRIPRMRCARSRGGGGVECIGNLLSICPWWRPNWARRRICGVSDMLQTTYKLPQLV